MKKRMKRIIGLSVLALAFSATAAVLPLANDTAKADTPTGVFEIADGASIRTGNPIGIRFIVKMSSDVKDKIVNNNYKFGFVAGREDSFDGVTEYVNMTNGLKSEAVEITSDNVLDYFYEGSDDYAGYWCANVVINMGANDNVNSFVKRTYSAVAYYTDGTSYEYSANRQERNVQTVASRVYLSGNTLWDNVKNVYGNLGSAEVPLLVEQDGYNAYNNLLDKCDEDGAEYHFALTENVIAETDLSTADKDETGFKGAFVANEFAVSSPEGYVLDGTDASDIQVATVYEDYTATISFDNDVKYDGASNGSYKIEAKTNTEGGLEALETLSFNLKPVYRSGYYQKLQELQENGYTHIAIRYMMEKFDYSGTVRFNYISSSGEDEMAIYYDGSKIVNKSPNNTTPNGSYTFWQSEMSRVPTGAWAEMVLDITKFTDTYKDEAMSLFHLVVNSSSSLDMVMYIDNIYAVKGEATATQATSIKKINDEVDLSTLTADTGITNAIFTAELDGQTVAVADNKLKIAEYGVYSVDIKDRTLYGSIQQDFMAQGTVASFVSKNFAAKHIINSSGATTNYTPTKTADGKIVLSSDGAGKVTGVSMTTYAVQTVGDAAYYTALQTAGYKYITYEYTPTFTGVAEAYDIYTYGLVTGDNKHANTMNGKSFEVSYKIGTTDVKTTTLHTSYGYRFNTSYPQTNWSGKTIIVSIPIQTVIANYETTGSNLRIMALYFSKAGTDIDYSVAFSQICATANPCVFDTPPAADAEE